MNAEQLYEIVKDWPREAWPTTDGCLIHFSGCLWYEDDSDECGMIHTAHAAALFRDSGLRWLLRRGSWTMTENATGAYVSTFFGEDMLHAISAAISAAIKRVGGEG